MRQQRFITCVLLVSFLSGCGSLVIREGDSEDEISNKKGVREVLEILTLGFSEKAIKSYEEGEQERKRAIARWNSLIGNLTYDDALMAWGPPTQVEAGQSVMVATWYTVTRGPDIIVKNIIIPGDRKSTRLNSSHVSESRMPSSA